MATWEKRAGKTCKAIFDMWNKAHISGVIRGYMETTNQDASESIFDILENAPLLQQMAERCEITTSEVCEIIRSLQENDSELYKFGV